MYMHILMHTYYLCMQMLLLDLFPQEDTVTEACSASEARFYCI